MRHKYCQKCIIRASSWGWQAFLNEGIEAFEEFFHLYIVRTRQLLPRHDLFVARVLWASVCVGLTFTVIFFPDIYHILKKKKKPFLEFVQLFSHVQLFVTPWTVARQSSLYFIISRTLLKFMSIESVMPSNHIIRPLLSPFPPAFNLSQHQDLFQWVSSMHQVAKVLELQLQHQSHFSCFTECYSFQNCHMGTMSSFLSDLLVKSLCRG